MAERRVVVTGIGTINPLGNNIEEYFRNLEKGVSGAAPITHFDAEKFKTRFACEVKNYDPNQYFDRKEVRKYDLFTQYALIAATQAVEDAAFDFDKLDKERAGVIWASGIGGLKSFFDECLGYAEGGMTPRFSPFFIPRMISDIAAGFISMKYGFMGPNYCTVSACASSNHGLIAALEAIRYGKADVMITGGSEAAVNEPSVGGFNSMQALSSEVVGVGRLAAADELAVNLGAASLGMLQLFEHERTGTLADHETVAVLVERTRSVFGIVVAGGEGATPSRTPASAPRRWTTSMCTVLRPRWATSPSSRPSRACWATMSTTSTSPLPSR